VTHRSPTRTPLLLLAALSAAFSFAAAQVPHSPTHKPKPYQPPYNPNMILLDPAHGGADAGADLGAAGEEKDYNQAFAERLRTLLTDQGFTVVLTHPSASDDTPADQRAEIANHSRAVACLILHASNSGHGVHLFTSSLTPPSTQDPSHSESTIAPWDSAQAGSLTESQDLANQFSDALGDERVPLFIGRSSIRPIDSMTCPALALEIAPSAAGASLADEDYQQQVAEAAVSALSSWRQQAQALIATQQAAAEAAAAQAAQAAGNAAAARPKARPRLPAAPLPMRPKPFPAPSALPHKPAPIIRRPPPAATPAPQGVRP
jgi:N-acetylmuramoyl-L-alanine amidase